MLRPMHLLPPERLSTPRSARGISPASSGSATGRSDDLPGRDLHPLVRCSFVTHVRPIRSRQMNLRDVEERLAVVLNNATGWLPAEQLADMELLAKSGEPGVALENFCTQLEEYDVAVPADVARELREIAGMMSMKVSSWIERSADA